MKKLLAITLCMVMVLAMMPALNAASADDMRTVTIMTPSERRADHPLSRMDEYTCWQVFNGWLQEKNVQLEFDLISPEQYDDTLKMRLAAQLDLADLISFGWGFGDADMMQLVNNGLLVNVLDACEQYDDDGSIWGYLDNLCPVARGLTTAPDGGIYWFVYPFHSKIYHVVDGAAVEYPDQKEAVHSININKDWMDTVGLEYNMFMTPEEFKDALVAFRENDANGNGVADEVFDIDITTFENGIAAAFGLFGTGIIDGTDTVHCAWYADGIKDYLTYMNDLYNIGVYDTKVLSDGMIDQTCAAGEASAFYAYMGWSSTYDFTEDKYLYAPIILDDDKGENGFNFTRRDSSDAIYMKFGINSACSDLEACIDVYDCVYTDDYATLSYFGTEATYGVNEFGFKFRNYDTALLNDPNWVDLPFMYSIAMNALPAIRDADIMIDEQTHMPAWDEYVAMCDYVYTNDANSVSKQSLQTLAVPTDEEIETLNSLETVIETYSSELVTDMILGRKSIDDLDQYIEEMKGLGLDDYLGVYQSRHDRYVEANK